MIKDGIFLEGFFLALSQPRQPWHPIMLSVPLHLTLQWVPHITGLEICKYSWVKVLNQEKQEVHIWKHHILNICNCNFYFSKTNKFSKAGRGTKPHLTLGGRFGGHLKSTAATLPLSHFTKLLMLLNIIKHLVILKCPRYL